MKSRSKLLVNASLLVLAVGSAALLAKAAPQLNADRIAQAAGAKATTAKDGVVRIAWARSDVSVKVDGMPLQPFAGLGAWAAFTPAPHGAMVDGRHRGLPG